MLKYFGTDGIRGKSPEWLNEDIAYRIGYALGASLKAKKILIGRDTREGGFFLNKALNQGAIDSGVNTINLGIVSTPMVQYLSLKENIFGIMITASHNPSGDNGIKVIQNGDKISSDQELMIEKYIDNQLLSSNNLIDFAEDKSRLNQYFDDLSHQFNFKSDYDVYLDTANGSLSSYAEDIIS